MDVEQQQFLRAHRANDASQPLATSDGAAVANFMHTAHDVCTPCEEQENVDRAAMDGEEDEHQHHAARARAAEKEQAASGGGGEDCQCDDARADAPDEVASSQTVRARRCAGFLAYQTHVPFVVSTAKLL